MKRYTLQIIAFLFLSAFSNVRAQLGSCQWQYSNPKPFGFLCYQFAYADNNTALVVGEAGGIAKTTDGGATWTYFAYTTTNGSGEVSRPVFNDLQCVSSSLAYAVGNDGIMIKSIDGGTNWSLVTTPFYAAEKEINTVFFTSADTGYIGGDGDQVTRRATMYKTTNGGVTWEPFHEFPTPVFEWDYGAIYKIRFTTSGVGYVGGGSGMVWKYNNGTWSDYSITPTTVYPNVNDIDTIYRPNWEGGIDTVVSTYTDNIFGLNQQNYRAIAILNDTAVVVGTQNNGGLIRINTSNPTGSYLLLNNGSALSPVYYPLEMPQIYNLVTKDGITVAGAAEGGKMLLSRDRGFSWQAQDVYPTGSNEAGIAFYGIDISPAGRFGLCGQAGIVADSVTQWRRPFRFVTRRDGGGSYSIATISFANADYGIAAGSSGGMMRTSDGGNNWEDISNASFQPGENYTSVAYTSPNTLLAAADNGMFYKSVDRGETYDLLFTEASAGRLDAMHFINEDTGWLVANTSFSDADFNYFTHTIIYRTTDGGITWDSSNTVFPVSTNYYTLNDIKFFNGSIGYAADENGLVYKSTDGGITWVTLTNMPAFAIGKPITSIAVVDANTVYASGGQALVMKTTDGGNNWEIINSGLPGGFNRYPKILMYDASQGLLFGRRGVVYSTNNGGGSWTPYYVPNADNLGAATFTPIPGCTTGICNKVFTGTSGGNIIKLDADVVLPVKFSKLTGTGTTAGNQLFWTAFEQESVTYFEIERSADGVHFQKIADKVYPGGLNYQSYQWLDATASGRNYYRIKAVERGGAIYYTNIVMIATKTSPKWNYILNSDNLILNNAKLQQGNVTAMVMNPAGQMVAAKSWNQNGGAFNQVVLLPVSAKGIYVVKIDNEGAVYSFKIFIQ